MRQYLPIHVRAIVKHPNSSLYRSVVFCTLAMPGYANAHAMFGSAAPFWSGVLHVLVTPLALAAISVLVLALAEATEGAILRAVAGAALAAFGAAEVTLTAVMSGCLAEVIAAASIAVLGVVTALTRRPSTRLACVLGVGAGIAAGGVVGPDVPDWGGSFGVGIALLVLASWGAAGLAHLQQRFAQPVRRVRRVAAIMVAAIAMMLAVASMWARG